MRTTFPAATLLLAFLLLAGSLPVLAQAKWEVEKTFEIGGESAGIISPSTR
jgi:hypothetical protein